MNEAKREAQEIAIVGAIEQALVEAGVNPVSKAMAWTIRGAVREAGFEFVPTGGAVPEDFWSAVVEFEETRRRWPELYDRAGHLRPADEVTVTSAAR